MNWMKFSHYFIPVGHHTTYSLTLTVTHLTSASARPLGLNITPVWTSSGKLCLYYSSFSSVTADSEWVLHQRSTSVGFNWWVAQFIFWCSDWRVSESGVYNNCLVCLSLLYFVSSHRRPQPKRPSPTLPSPITHISHYRQLSNLTRY